MLKNSDIVSQIRKRKQNDNLITGKIGATIKLKRKDKEQTLNNLSELFGVSISYLSKVENDLLKPNINYLTDVLGDLEINEDLLNDSLEMNDWYKMLIKHLLKIFDYKKQLNEFINERNDFQAKMVDFSLLIFENKFTEAMGLVKGLLENMSVMHKVEIYIFIMSVALYYIKIENHFGAGELMKELGVNPPNNTLLKLWYLEIKYELTLYQSSLTNYLDAANELASHYYVFNLQDKLADLRERSTAALAYFLEPDKFVDYLYDEEMYRSYRLSHIYFEQYQNFEKLEKRNDLAQLLFDEIKGNHEKVQLKWTKVEYREDPFEQTLKEYFKYKYDYQKEMLFLKESIFARTGLSQHYFSSHFIADILINKYSSEHKYKQCYLLGERIKKLDFLRKSYLEL